jgi:hypothetical protein
MGDENENCYGDLIGETNNYLSFVSELKLTAV